MRHKICMNFALRSEKQSKFMQWYKPKVKMRESRQREMKYLPAIGRTTKYNKSPICFLTDLLNTYYLNLS